MPIIEFIDKRILTNKYLILNFVYIIGGRGSVDFANVRSLALAFSRLPSIINALHCISAGDSDVVWQFSGRGVILGA